MAPHFFAYHTPGIQVRRYCHLPFLLLSGTPINVLAATDVCLLHVPTGVPGGLVGYPRAY